MNYRTTESHVRVDLSTITPLLKKHGDNCKMSFTGTSHKETVSVIVEISLARQRCKLNGHLVELTTTSCNYGNVRYWFTCPLCGSRCRLLYWSNYWACRKCQNLVYISQQATKTDFLTWYDKAVKVARVIAPDYSIKPIDILFTSFLTLLFPTKPKYMKWAKYERLRTRFCAYARISQKLNRQELSRLSLLH